LDKRAFFFQGDALLMPADFPGSQIDNGLSLELINDFNHFEIFKIPAIKGITPSFINTVSILAETDIPDNWKKIPLRQLLAGSAANGGNIDNIIRACHIAQWRLDSRYCGTCGTKNNEVSAQAYRLCPNCGRLEFPRICPAIIVLINDSKDRILLAHNINFKTRVYSHISGFNEAGETLEETVAREVREEINIEICDITYVKSQAWPFPNSLMLGFKARYLSGTIKPDGIEIEDASWFDRDNLPELPGLGSLSRVLIDSWLSGAFKK